MSTLALPLEQHDSCGPGLSGKSAFCCLKCRGLEEFLGNGRWKKHVSTSLYLREIRFG